MKNAIMTLMLAVLVPAVAQAKVIRCYTDDGEAGVSSFKFNTVTKRASGFYDNLDEGIPLAFKWVSYDEGKSIYGFEATNANVKIELNMLSYKAVGTDLDAGIVTQMTCE